MSHIDDLEDERHFKNNLGRENRSAIRRSLIMALMAACAVTAAVLLAPASDPSPIRLDASASAAAPAPAPASTDAVVGSNGTEHESPPGHWEGH